MEGFRSALNEKDDLRMDFKFEDLGLKLKDGKVVLRGVTGMIRSRRLTAIMGPSGAGKTTFMNVLMGKVARTGGKLIINGQEAEMSKYKKIIGYVPQEDIMLRELTVKENIKHSARVRLPSVWSEKRVEGFVDSVLDVLNLDSTAALKVAEILKRIASIGLTVVAVIHQPRFEIFQQFDDILMIAPGGKTAYLGPTECVLEYFEGYGFFFDPRSNPADILMDILSDKGVNLHHHYTPTDLVNLWETQGSSWVQKKYAQQGLSPSSEPCKVSVDEMDVIVKGRGAGWWRQVLICHNRYLVQQFRLVGALVLEIGVGSLAGGLVGGSFIV
ncbi:hypothetical protein HDU67_004082 [Dinochytrium kinnereticum]|nr:hypothetical protein HDU67_004082 [Dinochytrium kinnereticum]